MLGAQLAPDQSEWEQGREAPGITEQGKHRRLWKAPYAPAFMLPGHLLAASMGHRIQGLDTSLFQGIKRYWKCCRGKRYRDGSTL